jgi:SAM-dependent methyltransferase
VGVSQKRNFRAAFVAAVARHLGEDAAEAVRSVRRTATRIECLLRTVSGKLICTRLRLLLNRRAKERRLEIGPGKERLPGFETLDFVGGRSVDYVLDAAKRLPFKDDTFEVVYASHLLEHIPWYQTREVLAEWVRVLKPGGVLEVWVPDAAKVFETVLAADSGQCTSPPEEWRARNDEDDVYLWAAGRLLWGANPEYPSWHKAVFTPQSLRRAMEAAGLSGVRRLEAAEARGIDHGWINLGISGTKP